jgi:hypothetical protein
VRNNYGVSARSTVLPAMDLRINDRALIVTLRNASSELILARRASEGCAAALGDSLACASSLYSKPTIKASVAVWAQAAVARLPIMKQIRSSLSSSSFALRFIRAGSFS